MRYIGDADFDPNEVNVKTNELIQRFAFQGTLSGRLLFRPRPSPPPLLYKYTSATNAIQYILPDLMLRYTQSEVLNDVFEEAPSRDEIRRMMPGFEDGPTFVIDVADTEERLTMFDRVKRARERMRKNDVTLSDDIAIFTSGGLHRDWKYHLGNQPFKYIMEEIRKPLALSLTERENSNRMWSEYADDNRGICLGFDSRHKYFRANRDLIGTKGYFAPVIYRDLSPEDYAYMYPHERFFIKIPDWSDQREWRRIDFVDQFHNDSANSVHSFPFPADALKLITFGARCRAADVDAITKLVCSRASLSHVKLYSVKRSIGSLKVERI